MIFSHKNQSSHRSLHTRRQLLKAGIDLGLGLSIWSGLGAGLSACASDGPNSATPSMNSLDTDMMGMNDFSDMNESATIHWWQQGNFAPVQELYADQLTVIGDLPPQLNGTYLRNGPNLSVGDSKHFFDGDGMVHAITIADGKAQKYQSRYVKTPRHGIANPLPPSLHDYHCNVSVLYHGDQLLALGEIGYPFVLNAETLETQGVYNYQDALQTAMTAHPRVDPQNGELLFFGYGFSSPYLTQYTASAQGELIHSTEIPLDTSVLMHDFAITPNYCVFMDQPVIFDPLLAASAPLPYRWENDRATRIGLLGRGHQGDQITWIEIDGGFVFHFFNAWEDHDQVVVEGVRYPHMWKDNVHDLSAIPQVWRWTVSTQGELISSQALSDALVELPQIATHRMGQKHRYSYAVHYDQARYHTANHHDVYQLRPNTAGGIWCFDHQQQQEKIWQSAADEIPGEAIFVADTERSVAGSEEVGFLLSLVYKMNEQRSELVVLDSENVEQGPIARVVLPQRVPYGFHGTWVDQMFLA